MQECNAKKVENSACVGFGWWVWFVDASTSTPKPMKNLNYNQILTIWKTIRRLTGEVVIAEDGNHNVVNLDRIQEILENLTESFPEITKASKSDLKELLF
jgi:hypothetical protein